MSKRSVKTHNKHVAAAQGDAAAAVQAFMAVNEALKVATTVARALNRDADLLGNPEFTRSARRLQRVVERMKDGPNTALWADITNLERIAAAAYIRE